MGEPDRKSLLPLLLAAAGMLLLGAVAYFVWPLLTGGLPPPDVLESRALDPTSTADHRAHAALQLTEHGAKAQTQMRKLLTQSKDSDVRAAALQGLTTHGDWSDMPQMMKSLNDPSPWVRTRAAQATWRHLGSKFGYNPHASEAERAAAIKKIQDHYQWQDDYRRLHHDSPTAHKMP